jgi:uncharacterized protein (DUF433 family)
MTLKELETQLLELTPQEKTQVIELLSQNLGRSGRGIQKTPGVCGGSACIGNSRITVWGLVNSRRIGISESQLLLDYPQLTANDLVNAWVYADAHADEIESLIVQNQEA